MATLAAAGDESETLTGRSCCGAATVLWFAVAGEPTGDNGDRAVTISTAPEAPPGGTIVGAGTVTTAGVGARMGGLLAQPTIAAVAVSAMASAEVFLSHRPNDQSPKSQHASRRIEFAQLPWPPIEWDRRVVVTNTQNLRPLGETSCWHPRTIPGPDAEVVA